MMLLTWPAPPVCRLPEKARKAKPPKAALNELEERSGTVTRNLLVALTARVAFFLLPFLPLRVKSLSVLSKVRGAACDTSHRALAPAMRGMYLSLRLICPSSAGA